MARILVVCVWVVVALGLTGCGAKWDPKAFNAGAPAGTGFEYRDLPGSDRKYGVFIPHDYDGTRAYPAVVFLHGLFENGSDPKSSMLVGLGPVVAERKLAAGYIIVFPQARSDWRSKDELLLAKHSKIDGNVILTDFRNLKDKPVGNRFLVFTMFREANVEVRLFNGHEGAIVAAVGASIFNRTCKVNIGQMLAEYGGGGHKGAGTAQLKPDMAEKQIQEIIARLKA